VRELEYYADGGGWIAQRGSPQPWEADYFFSDAEGTEENASWPSNLSDDLSTADMARYEEARSQRAPAAVMDLLQGGSITRLCESHGVDPKRAGGHYQAPPNWRVAGTLLAIGLLLVGACILGVLFPLRH
jgi:hypothetical protein